MKTFSRFITAGFILGLLIGVAPLQADEITYQPVNPNFGGSPFNGALLLNSALSQNDFRAQSGEQAVPTTNELFQASLDRAILNRLTRDLVDEAFGGSDGLLDTGTFDTGTNTITIAQSGGNTTLTLTDNTTGDVTVIVIPGIGTSSP